MTRAGVYAIVCEPTGEVYVGATIDLDARRPHHMSALKYRRHSCKRLQSLHDAHGADAFRWEELEVVTLAERLTEALGDAEVAWMARLLEERPGSVVNRKCRYSNCHDPLAPRVSSHYSLPSARFYRPQGRRS
jgi:hypothetical protein